MNKRNYQKELDVLLEHLEQETLRPKLLLHACCAPCSSYVLEYLSRYFSIVLFYYNPNISPQQEYEKRVAEVRRLLQEMPLAGPVTLTLGDYEPERFFDLAKGHEAEPEGGDRCTPLLPPAPDGSGTGCKGPGMRLFYHNPFHQPLQKRREIEYHRRGAGERVRRPLSILRLQKAERIQALHRVEPGIQPLPPELLRMRLFPRGSPGAGRQIKRTKGTFSMNPLH